MAVSISMNIIQNSQSIENNTSNVTVEVYAHWTRGSYNAQTASDGYPDARGTVSIDGASYAFYSKFNTGRYASGSERIFVKTLDISHNNEGEKVLSCWASYDTGVSSGTVSTSGSLALTTIPRKSVLTASNGTLGTAQTLKVERKSTLLTHTITYSCAGASGTICTKSTSTSLSWTPPVSLAAQYPNAASVSVNLTITTYNADTNIGSSTVTISCAIPASVAPSVSLSVSDPMGYLSKYGAYVQGKSKIRIVAAASGNQGSTIKAYKTEADGKSYTAANVTTDVIKGTGTLTVKVTVTDSRGRTATASKTISVLAYTAPNISSLSVSRCDASGNASNSGAYLAVRFNAAITALNSKNSAAYTVQYKKSSVSYYTTQTLTAYAGKYSVSNGVYIFAAETASSYDVVLTAKDDFTSTQKSNVGSSIKKTWSILKNGLGFAFGKIAEVANCLDMGWFIKMNGNKITELATPTDSKDAVNKSYVDTNFAPAGYGLGASAKPITDLNQALNCGWYSFGYPTSNAPFGYGAVMVINRYGTDYIQLAFDTALADANHNGAIARRVYNGKVWSNWEFINPPMKLGVEYRTTERWNGVPVYCKCVDCGEIPSGSAVAIYTNSGAPVGSPIRWSGLTADGISLPYMPYVSDRSADMTVGVQNSTIFISVGIGHGTKHVYVNVWYIK